MLVSMPHCNKSIVAMMYIMHKDSKIMALSDISRKRLFVL